MTQLLTFKCHSKSSSNDVSSTFRPRHRLVRRQSAPTHNRSLSWCSNTRKPMEAAAMQVGQAKQSKRTRSLSRTVSFQGDPSFTPLATRDWTSAIKDAKVLYSKRQYKLCAEKCDGHLSNLKGTALYGHSLFFSFLAATCYELLASSMPVTSRSRLSLLNRAKDSYQNSAGFLFSAEVGCHRYYYERPSQSPNTNSPSWDILADGSASSSCSSTPASSIYDSDSSEGNSRPSSKTSSKGTSTKRSSLKGPSSKNSRPSRASLPIRKRVSFQTDNKPISEEPILDSDLDLLVSPPSPTTITAISAVKKIINPRSSLVLPQGPPPNAPLPPLPLPLAGPSTSINKTQTLRKRRSRPLFSPMLPVESTTLLKVAYNRNSISYQSQLLAFGPEISCHLNRMAKLIYEATLIIPEDKRSESDSDESEGSGKVEERGRTRERVDRMSDKGKGKESENVGVGFRKGKAQMSFEEKRKRIENMKGRLWVRERFDGGRYRRLCESALKELEINQ